MPINMENFSQFHQYGYYSNKINNNTTNYQQAPVAIKKDTFNFMGKELSKKKTIVAVIAVAALAATAITAFIKRKNISQFIQNLKIKNKPITSYENLTPEKIVIPEGGYDLSKEAGVLEYTTGTYDSGYSWHKVGKKEGSLYEDLKSITNNTVGDIGVTPKGHAFVKTSTVKTNWAYEPTMRYMTLISPNSEFTPAQKNLIALMQQGKIQSPNSPLGKKSQEYTIENIFDLIHKWAQDIDPNNLDTQKVLSQVSTYKKGESNFVEDVIAQKVERAHFFR